MGFLLSGDRWRDAIRGGFVVGLLWCATSSVGEEVAKPLAPIAPYASAVGPLVEQFCFDCHTGEDAEGGLQIDALGTGDDFQRDRRTWVDILKRVRIGDMPPADMPQPSADERAAIVAWLTARLEQMDCTAPVAATAPALRRLNRRQYANTIRDLLGVDFDPTTLFPPDELAYGFDNNGAVLTLSAAQLEKYLTAAGQIVRRAIPAAEDLAEKGERLRVSAPGGGYAIDEYGWMLSTSTRLSGAFVATAAGRYAVRARVLGEQAGDEPIRMAILVGDSEVARVEVHAEADEHENFVILVDLAAGERVELGVAFLNDYFNPIALNTANRDRNLIVDSIEVVGPMDLAAAAPAKSRELLLRETPALGDWRRGEGWQDVARSRLRDAVRLAYRRPPLDDEIERLVGVIAAARARGDTYERGLQTALQAVLVAPSFLYFDRSGFGGSADDAGAPVDELTLAARLSYFLWASTPDERLLGLAEAQQLRPQLDAEVQRMLADPRAESLATEFAGQWLETRRLETLTPDPDKFPEFDAELSDALRRETEQFFLALVRENRPLGELLDADYTFLNERLAKHYGVAGVAGPEFRRVTLSADDRRRGRGGVLGLGSVLAATSHPDRTSPVVRGKFILANLLGDEPPPPPPDAPALPATDAAIASGTLRQRLEAHRADPSCAVCHNDIDPLGFALERYDALGRWRDSDAGQAIDDEGSLRTGETFRGPAGLRGLLVGRLDQFRATLAEKLLTYAIGRGLEYYDQCAARDVVARTQAADDRFHALILAVTQSAPFQQRGGALVIGE